MVHNGLARHGVCVTSIFTSNHWHGAVMQFGINTTSVALKFYKMKHLEFPFSMQQSVFIPKSHYATHAVPY